MEDWPPWAQGEGSRGHPKKTGQGVYFFLEKVVFWHWFSYPISGTPAAPKSGTLPHIPLGSETPWRPQFWNPQSSLKVSGSRAIFCSGNVAQKMLEIGLINSRVDSGFYVLREHPSAQALSMWKWNQYLHSLVPNGKIALNINLDETNLALWQPRHRGNVSLRKWPSVRHVRSKFICNVTLNSQRSNITHVAMCCDRVEIQPRLPQFLLASGSVLRKRDVPLVHARLPPNMFLIRCKSSWSNEAKMKIIFRKLVEVLADVRQVYQPILFFDTAPPHLHASLFDYLGREGIFVGLVPASMTWLLQVLDVAVFAHYKKFFKSRFHAKRAETPSGKLSVVEVIEIIALSVKKVLQGHKWRDAFASLGFHGTYENVSAFVLESLEMPRVPPIPTSKPTEMEMRCIWPLNRVPHYNELFRWVDPETSILALLAPVLPMGPALPAVQPLLALPPPPPSHAPDTALPAASATPRIMTLTRQIRRRTLPPSFAPSRSGGSSSRDHADPLDAHLHHAASTNSWISDGRVLPP